MHWCRYSSGFVFSLLCLWHQSLKSFWRGHLTHFEYNWIHWVHVMFVVSFLYKFLRLFCSKIICRIICSRVIIVSLSLSPSLSMITHEEEVEDDEEDVSKSSSSSSWVMQYKRLRGRLKFLFRCFCRAYSLFLTSSTRALLPGPGMNVTGRGLTKWKSFVLHPEQEKAWENSEKNSSFLFEGTTSCEQLLHFNRFMQHGMAAKMSYAYIDPRIKWEPSHRLLQPRHLRLQFHPSRQPMQMAFRYFFSGQEANWAAILELDRLVMRETADLPCCLGDTKNVPSMRGNFSKMGIELWHRIQSTLKWKCNYLFQLKWILTCSCLLHWKWREWGYECHRFLDWGHLPFWCGLSWSYSLEVN